MAENTYDLIIMRKKVKKALDKDRYEHTKGVMYTACSLAMAYGYDLHKAMVAGLLHDCAKCIPHEEKIDLCRKNHMPVNEIELANPGLLHAKAGAILAERRYGVKDPEILHAIRVHTTGEPEMSLLDRILFVADYIEPGRCQAPRLPYLRQLAFGDLDACTAEILSDTLKYLGGRLAPIDPMTQITFDYYKSCLKEK